MANPVNDQFDKVAQIREQLRLIKERGLHSYLNRDLPKFLAYFERLKALRDLPASNERFQEAYELFYYVFDAVPVMYHRLSEMPVFRATGNKVGEVFSTQGRISYNPNHDSILPGKFNVYYQSMFYGCLPYEPIDEKLYPEPRLVAALECCKPLYRPKQTLYIQDITVGRWHIQQPIDAINLCFDQVHLAKNPELKAINDQYLNHLLTAFSPAAGRFIVDLFAYFSELCRTGSDEQAYYVLSALFAALKIYHETNTGTKVEALISVSHASEGHGLNIVITPDAVDRCLKLNAVVMDRYFLVLPEKRTFVNYPCSEIVFNTNNIPDFNFEFRNYRPLAESFIERHHLDEYGYSKKEYLADSDS